MKNNSDSSNQSQNLSSQPSECPRPAQQSGLTREAFLRRCETIFDAGLATPSRLRLLDKWVDFVCRFEGGQMRYVADFIEDEAVRCERFSNNKTLANDREGYSLVELTAILNHPCQSCAEDLKAWWTRAAFCEHKKPATNTDASSGTTAQD